MQMFFSKTAAKGVKISAHLTSVSQVMHSSSYKPKFPRLKPLPHMHPHALHGMENFPGFPTFKLTSAPQRIPVFSGWHVPKAYQPDPVDQQCFQAMVSPKNT